MMMSCSGFEFLGSAAFWAKDGYVEEVCGFYGEIMWSLDCAGFVGSFFRLWKGRRGQGLRGRARCWEKKELGREEERVA